MKRLRWQILVVVLALAAIGVLLYLQEPPAAVLPGQPTEAPVQGGTYTEAVVGLPGRFNPLLDIYNPADRDVSRLIFSGLVRFDASGVPVLDLAESLGISADNAVYNFSIRPEAVWHDGQPVTSEDVSFTIDLLRNPDLPIPEDIRELWEQVEVVVINEKTIQFRLPEPFAPFLDYLNLGILPRHLLADIPAGELVNAEFNLQPVGSGPFRFENLITQDGQIVGVVLKAYESHYAGRPFLDQVALRFYPDEASALTAYREGEVQGISRISGELVPQALAEEQLNLYTSRMPQLTLILINLENPELPFFQDPALRRALLSSLNRQWIVDRVLDGQAIVADGPILPGSWAYYESIEHLDYEPEQALKVIREAGYVVATEGSSVREKDGVAFSFELAYPDDAVHAEIVEAIRRDWGRLGVEVKPKPVTYAELITDYLEQRTYQAALVDLNLLRSPDPDPYPFWHQAQATGGQNYSGWNDRQASEFLERARTTTDYAERTKAYRNFQARFTHEMPALPLYYPVYNYGVDAAVLGVSVGPMFEPSDRFNTLPGWYLREAEAASQPTQATSTP